jgi:hypothetical protein
MSNKKKYPHIIIKRLQHKRQTPKALYGVKFFLCTKKKSLQNYCRHEICVFFLLSFIHASISLACYNFHVWVLFSHDFTKENLQNYKNKRVNNTTKMINNNGNRISLNFNLDVPISLNYVILCTNVWEVESTIQLYWLCFWTNFPDFDNLPVSKNKKLFLATLDDKFWFCTEMPRMKKIFLEISGSIEDILVTLPITQELSFEIKRVKRKKEKNIIETSILFFFISIAFLKLL